MNDDNFRKFVTEEDIATMQQFMAPMLATLRGHIPADMDSISQVALDSKEFCIGMLLYSRLTTNYSVMLSLHPLLGPLKEFFSLIKRGHDKAAVDYMLGQESELLSIAQRVMEAMDNIQLTQMHCQQYCNENGIDPIKTPYTN